MELARMDFQQLRIKHILFKTKVRALLYGGTYDEALFSAEGPVRVWFDTIGHVRYAKEPEMALLLKLHDNLITAARALYNRYTTGLIEQAHEDLKGLDLQSEQFLALLSKMEQRHLA